MLLGGTTSYASLAACEVLYQWGRETDGHVERTSPKNSINSNTDAPIIVTVLCNAAFTTIGENHKTISCGRKCLARIIYVHQDSDFQHLLAFVYLIN